MDADLRDVLQRLADPKAVLERPKALTDLCGILSDKGTLHNSSNSLVFGPYMAETIDVLISLVKEGTDNTILSLPIISDLIKAQHPVLKHKLQSVFEAIYELFKQFEQSGVKDPEPLRVLAECPTFIMSLSPYQQMPQGVKLIKLVLSSQRVTRALVHREEGETSVELLTMMANILKYLNHLLYHDDSEELENLMSSVPDVLDWLLKTCPRGEPKILHSLLITLRQFINFPNFRGLFRSKLYDWVDGMFLLGFTANRTLKIVFFSMLGDWVGYIQSQLEPQEMCKVTEAFTRNLEDSQGQTLCNRSTKVLLGMIEPIAKLPKDTASSHLSRILNAIADSYGNIRRANLNPKRVSQEGPIKTFSIAVVSMDTAQQLTALTEKTMDHFGKLVTTPDPALSQQIGLLSIEEEQILIKLVKEMVHIMCCLKSGIGKEEEYFKTLKQVCRYIDSEVLHRETMELRDKYPENKTLLRAIAVIESSSAVAVDTKPDIWSSAEKDEAQLPPLIRLSDKVSDIMAIKERRRGCIRQLRPDFSEYPGEFWQIIQESLPKPEHCYLLVDEILKAGNKSLRNWGTHQVGKLVKACSDIAIKGNHRGRNAIQNTMHIIATLSSLDTREWDLTEVDLKQLWEAFKRCGTISTFAANQFVPIFTKYLEPARGQHFKPARGVGTLFEFVTAFTSGQLVEPPNFREEVIYELILFNKSDEFLKIILHKCLQMCKETSISRTTKAYLLRSFVRPIISEQQSSVLDSETVESICSFIREGTQLDNLSHRGVDTMDIEVIQLSALLVKDHSKLVRHIRMDIANLVRSYSPSEVRHINNILRGYYIDSFGGPPDLEEDFVSISLEPHHLLLKELHTEALNLTSAIISQPNQQRLRDIFEKRVCQTLVNGIAAKSHLTTLLLFLFNHPELCGNSAAEIAVLIIHHICMAIEPSRLLFESRFYAMSLIWKLQQRYITETGADQPKVREFIPAPRRKQVLECLMALITELPPSRKSHTDGLTSTGPLPTNGVSHEKAMELFYNLRQTPGWKDTHVDLPDVMTAVISSSDTQAALDMMEPEKLHIEKYTSRIINAFQVIDILSPNAWNRNDEEGVQEFFKMCKDAKNPEIRDQVDRVIRQAIYTETDATKDESAKRTACTRGLVTVPALGDVKRDSKQVVKAPGRLRGEKDADTDLEKAAQSLVASPRSSKNMAILKLSVSTFIILLYVTVGFWPRWIGQFRLEA